MSHIRTDLFTIRIRKVPPTTGFLQPFNLSSYGFREGHVYRVPHEVADVLIAWNYAARVDHSAESSGDDNGAESGEQS